MNVDFVCLNKCICGIKNELLKKHNLLVYKFSAFTGIRPWQFSSNLFNSLVYMLMFIWCHLFCKHHVFIPYAEKGEYNKRCWIKSLIKAKCC